MQTDSNQIGQAKLWLLDYETDTLATEPPRQWSSVESNPGRWSLHRELGALPTELLCHSDRHKRVATPALLQQSN